jgi:hypothetical protein
MAHDMLKFLIGTDFYNFLVGEYPNFDATTLTFYDPYVKQFLAWQTYAYYIPKANVYETRTGVRVFKEANSEPASDVQMGALIRLANQQADFYKGAMINFLTNAQTLNSSAFPLYTETWPANKFGTSFRITAVTGRNSQFSRINTKTVINSDAPGGPDFNQSQASAANGSSLPWP